MDTPSPPPPTGPQLLLGVFIIGQLVFLVAINLLDMARDARDEMRDRTASAIERVVPGWPQKGGHVHDVTELTYDAVKRWSQVTGQLQGWSLFAPNIGRHCVFPCVVLRWDEDPGSASILARHLGPLAAVGPFDAAALLIPAAHRAVPPRKPVELRSDNEPKDVHAYFRLGHFRLRRYEGNVTIILRPWEDESEAERKERYRERVKELLRKYGDTVHAYLRWRWEAYRRQHPEAPAAKQVILVLRRFTINDRAKAPSYWSGPHEEYVARWQPQPRAAARISTAWDAGGSLEPYDAVTQRFVAPH